MTGLGLRLFQLQVAHAAEVQARAAVRQTDDAHRSPWRAAYLRPRGRLLVENVPTFVLRIVPAELPYDVRPDVAERLAELTDLPARRDHRATRRPRRLAVRGRAHRGRRDGDGPRHQRGSRIATRVSRDRPGGAPRLPAGRPTRPRAGLDGPHLRPGVPAPQDDGYSPEDLLGKAGLEATYEDVLRGTYGLEEVTLDAQGQELHAPRVLADAVPGRSLELTIDLRAQQNAEKALEWAMAIVGIDRGVVMAMNPQNGEILAMVSLPSYDNNAFAQGITTAEYRKLLRDPARPHAQPGAISEQNPPGSTYKLVTGSGALQDGKITPSTTVQTEPFIEIGKLEVLGLEQGRLRPRQHLRRLRPLERHLLLPAGGHAGHRPPGLLGAPVGLREPTGIDLPGEVAGHRAHQRLEAAHPQRAVLHRARSTRPASGRATT